MSNNLLGNPYFYLFFVFERLGSTSCRIIMCGFAVRLMPRQQSLNKFVGLLFYKIFLNYYPNYNSFSFFLYTSNYINMNDKKIRINIKK